MILKQDVVAGGPSSGNMEGLRGEDPTVASARTEEERGEPLPGPAR